MGDTLLYSWNPDEVLRETSVDRAAAELVQGSNFNWRRLNYEHTTVNERVFVFGRMPGPDLYTDGDDVKVEISWVSDTATVGTVRWVAYLTGFADGETWDTGIANTLIIEDARTSANALHVATGTFSSPTLSPGDEFVLRVNRQANHANDTYGADAWLTMLKLIGTSDLVSPTGGVLLSSWQATSGIRPASGWGPRPDYIDGTNFPWRSLRFQPGMAEYWYLHGTMPEAPLYQPSADLQVALPWVSDGDAGASGTVRWRTRLVGRSDEEAYDVTFSDDGTVADACQGAGKLHVPTVTLSAPALEPGDDFILVVSRDGLHNDDDHEYPARLLGARMLRAA